MQTNQLGTPDLATLVKDVKTLQLKNLANLPQLIRPKQACVLLSISKPTLYRLINADKLQLVKIGERASAIPSESIENYLRSINAISL